DVAHLAGADQIVQCAHGFIDRRVLVPRVHPVKIDVIRLQPAQRFFAGPIDILATGAAGIRIADAHIGEKFGGDDGLMAFRPVAPEVIADDFFGVAVRVEIRGIDEVAAEVEIAVDDALAVGHAGAPAHLLAEGHTAEAERTDAQAGTAQGYVMIQWHNLSPSRDGGTTNPASNDAASKNRRDVLIWRLALQGMPILPAIIVTPEIIASGLTIG